MSLRRRKEAAAPELTPIEPHSLEARIEREAQRFDLRPLLELLFENGYSRDEILFEGTTKSGSPTLVHAVSFRNGKMYRSVLITVHLGLLGDSGVLPSYFLRVADGMDDKERFFDFLRFFDHRLIDNMVDSLYPEDRLWRTGNTLRSFLRMTAPASPSTLWWLVQLHFPELGVRVTRRPFENVTAAHACRTGESSLDGSAILGYTYVSDMDGFQVDLITEDEVNMRGRDQADIVMERLRDRLLPLLAPFRLPLIVRLTVLLHRSPAHFDEPRDKVYLGYERLLPGRPERPPSWDADDRFRTKHTTVMYRGITGDQPAPPPSPAPREKRHVSL